MVSKLQDRCAEFKYGGNAKREHPFFFPGIIQSNGLYAGVYNLLNDLHVYNPVNGSWTNLSTPASGNPPSARYSHGFASAGGKLYVMGGKTGSQCDLIHNQGNRFRFLIWPRQGQAGI
jgi:hypothetical protein